ncbi:MAG: hypothetical protein U9P42_04850, partial [Candidatus Fermentibacteria bacterium]|nr:hypothetical protein [Candidatus Fermentibacteria bacterium]
MISAALLLSLFSYTVTLVSSGVEYIPLPSSCPWLDPQSITAMTRGDTLMATLTSRGPSVGLLLHPVPLQGDTVVIFADTLVLSVSPVSKLDIQQLERGESFQLPTFYGGYDPIPEGLYISGSKRLGVSLGSGGGISQGTELSIEGMLAPG